MQDKFDFLQHRNSPQSPIILGAIDIDKQNVKAFNIATRIFYEEAKYSKAEQMSRCLLKIGPENIDIISLFIIAIIPQGKLEEALLFCDKGLKLQPDNIFLLQYRIDIQIYIQQLINAEHYLFALPYVFVF